MTSGQVTGAALVQMLQASRLWLGRHRKILNDLNVYPVPDGDTGTNMYLTLNAALQAVSPHSLEATAGELWDMAAQGALAGSRGNSGVILSQYMRGMSKGMGSCTELSVIGLQEALKVGSEWANAAVNEPQEGTILTVAQDVAAAIQGFTHVDGVAAALQQVLPVAQASVERTPELLPTLKEAGVVDAGGLGLVFFLEGLLKGLKGETVDAVALDDPSEKTIDTIRAIASIPAPVHGFDVQFLSHHPQLPLEEMRTKINRMGEYGLVEGSSEMVKVHVHVPDPGPVLSWGCSIGFMTDVVVENMDAMAAARIEEGLEVPEEGRIRLLQSAALEEKAVVAVSSSHGFSQLFASLGANCLIECTNTVNPSVQQFRDAVEKVGGSNVVLLPNSVNAISAAHRAQESFPENHVAVIPTSFILNGVSAMYAFEQSLAWPALVAEMTAQAEALLFGAVAKATREVEGLVGRVASGDFVAMGQGKDVIGGGPHLADAVRIFMKGFLLPSLAQENASDFSLLTIYKGADLAVSEQDLVNSELSNLLPDFDLEWVDSRQRHYLLLIAAE